MPPKPKYTKEEIASAAFEIIKKDGLSALTARDLGAYLGTSSRPIFTYFRTMEELKLAAREIALREFIDYVSDYREYTPAFKRIGMMIVSYGIHKPELFKLLFMQEHKEKRGFGSTISDLGEISDVCTELIMKEYGMTGEQAELIFEQMWTQAYGLGVMCAMGVCDLSDEEIGRQLGIGFAGLMMLIRSGMIDEIHSDVEKNTDGTFHGNKSGDVPYK